MRQENSNTPQTRQTIEALWRLEKIILDTLDYGTVVQKICDGLLMEMGYLKLGYRIIVLTLVDEKKKVLKRVSLSQTAEAARALEASAVPFEDIDIPLDSENNLLIKTLKDQKPRSTHYWPDIFSPVLTPTQALKNQKASGIKTSMLYPIIVKGKAIGVVIFSMVKSEKEVSSDEKDLIQGFGDVIGLAVQNSRLYTTLQKTTTKLAEANKKLQALDALKDDFVSVASHELRTPMTAIKSYLWMALDGRGGQLTEKQKYYITRSYDSTERLIKLVNNMLNISRIESGRMSLTFSSVDLTKLVTEVIEEVSPRATELSIVIKQKPVAKLPLAIADADKIREVLINLIGNSLKFTPKNGLITIGLSVDDHALVTSVTDTGVGLSSEDQAHLFQKFGLMEGSYQTNHSSAAGSGLGLYICQQIINLHHGKIWATSAGINCGSVFSFSLPIATPKMLAQLKKYQHQSDVGIIRSTI